MLYSFWCQPVNREAKQRQTGDEKPVQQQPIEYIWFGTRFSIQYFFQFFIQFLFDLMLDITMSMIQAPNLPWPIRAFALMQIIILLAYSIWFSFILFFLCCASSFFLFVFIERSSCVWVSECLVRSKREKKIFAMQKKRTTRMRLILSPVSSVTVAILFQSNFLFFFWFGLVCFLMYDRASVCDALYSKIAANIFHVFCQKS